MYEAWELFSRKAFSSNHNEACPSELESLAWELVEKCEGLPLAIVALGGVMSSKKSPDEWHRVLKSINWHLNKQSLSKKPGVRRTWVRCIIFAPFLDRITHTQFL
ncbi:hypothetical protein ACLB2K_020867 [Fragaria x ananassa]